ncbi:hypothetical protein L21SP4_02475 [Kiritimatiella glycovorans]|uniref:Uncharacterized protein n=2 Tax=Kiritimatiella glycovorans TaxID=1307763 RepID=A0A0G3EH63_9BACT|nr:hypothetical protein L21SP4_02475 [Kiritimatiella glycovorans]
MLAWALCLAVPLSAAGAERLRIETELYRMSGVFPEMNQIALVHDVPLQGMRCMFIARLPELDGELRIGFANGPVPEDEESVSARIEEVLGTVGTLFAEQVESGEIDRPGPSYGAAISRRFLDETLYVAAFESSGRIAVLHLNGSAEHEKVLRAGRELARSLKIKPPVVEGGVVLRPYYDPDEGLGLDYPEGMRLVPSTMPGAGLVAQFAGNGDQPFDTIQIYDRSGIFRRNSIDVPAPGDFDSALHYLREAHAQLMKRMGQETSEGLRVARDHGGLYLADTFRHPEGKQYRVYYLISHGRFYSLEFASGGELNDELARRIFRSLRLPEKTKASREKDAEGEHENPAIR